MNGIGDGMGGMNEGMTMTLPYAKSQEPRRNAYVLMGLGKKKKHACLSSYALES